MDTNHSFSLSKIQLAFDAIALSSRKSKYSLLYEAIKQCILQMELPHHWLLPSTRLIANELEVSRSTVVKAYELLTLEKLILAKPGSGYRVNYSASNEGSLKKVNKANFTYPEISQTGKSYFENISLINRLPDNHIAFRPGLPPLDIFPVNQWKKLLNNYWRYVKTSGLTYTKSTGLIELKESVATYLKVCRNMKVDPHNIVIVSGSLQSLFLIANTIINPGDGVILENPVFPNVHSVFKSSRASIYPLEIDNEGIAIHSFNTNSSTPPKLLHVTPSNHYPLGVKMSLKRRKATLDWASSHHAIVIENDYENEIANVEESLPTLYSLDTEDRTIYIGTFNRLLHPSIRLGYMVVPRYLIHVVEALQEHSHRFVSPSIQIVMNQFIEKNYLYLHIQNCIAVAKERKAVFVEEFQKVSKKMVLLNHSLSSFHLIALFTHEASAEEESKVLQALKMKNITAFSLSKCYITTNKQKGLIFGYASLPTHLITKSIRKMQGIV